MFTNINDRKNKIKFIKEQKDGISTNLPTLDKMISGLQPGYHIIAARPSVGKTSLALNMATSIAFTNRVCFFSLEMNESKFLERIVSMLSGVSPTDIRSGNIKEDYKEAVANIDKKMSEMSMYVDYSSSHTPDSISKQFTLLEEKHHFTPEVVFIDYIQYMKTNGGGRPTTPANLAEISRDLVQISKNLKLPIVTLCQLNRGADEYVSKSDQKNWIPKVPRLSDLKGSGALEEDTDTVMLLHRSDYYRERESVNYDPSEAPISNASLIVAKNRQGPCGSFSMTWLPEVFKFSEYKE